jgi:hypothetical protein
MKIKLSRTMLDELADLSKEADLMLEIHKGASRVQLHFVNGVLMVSMEQWHAGEGSGAKVVTMGAGGSGGSGQSGVGMMPGRGGMISGGGGPG